MIKRILTISALAVSCVLSAQEWSPKQAPLMTEWGSRITPENAHREYPRPQMVRNEWRNLNGLWNYSITPIVSATPENINQGTNKTKCREFTDCFYYEFSKKRGF